MREGIWCNLGLFSTKTRPRRRKRDMHILKLKFLTPTRALVLPLQALMRK